MMYSTANLAPLYTARVTQLDVFQTIGTAMVLHQSKIHIRFAFEHSFKTKAGRLAVNRHDKLFVHSLSFSQMKLGKTAELLKPAYSTFYLCRF
jgi:hypothetical protein